MTKFGSEDLQSRGHVSPPHRKWHFQTDAATPATAGLLVFTLQRYDSDGDDDDNNNVEMRLSDKICNQHNE